MPMVTLCNNIFVDTSHCCCCQVGGVIVYLSLTDEFSQAATHDDPDANAAANRGMCVFKQQRGIATHPSR